MKTLNRFFILPVGFFCLLFFTGNTAIAQESSRASAFAGQWPEHSGKAIAMDSINQLIYLGDGDSINILDSNLNFISSFKVIETSQIGGIFYSEPDNLLYIACRTEGLKIYDLTDAENPLLVNLYTPDFDNFYNGFQEVNGVFIDGSNAYLSMGIDFMIILDITDINNLSMLSQYRSSGALGLNYVTDIYVTGNTAFIADTINGLYIVDVSNPLEPSYRGLSPYPASDISVSGAYLYTALQSIGMGILDISTPEQPVASSLFQAEDITTSVRADDKFAYISSLSTGVRALDITDKTKPTHNPEWIYDASGASSLGLFPDANAIFCANDQFGLQKLDITDKSNMQPLATHDTPADAIAIDVANNYIYSVDNTVGNAPEKEGLRIHWIDALFEPGEVNFIFNYKGFCATPGTASDIAVDGDYAFVADGIQGLQIVSITDKTSPEIIGNYDTSGNAFGIFIDGNYAYMADGDQGIVIIDITDKTNPMLTANLGTDGFARNIYISEDYAYVAADDQGLIIINIFNKTNPAIIGVYDTPGTARGIYVKDNYAYVADGDNGISIIDISDKTTPMLAGTLDTDGFAENISVLANYVYVADGLNGLSTIDASDPSLPVTISELSYNSSGNATDVFTGYSTEDEESYIFIADGAAGIVAVNLSITDIDEDDETGGSSGGGGCFVQAIGR